MFAVSWKPFLALLNGALLGTADTCPTLAKKDSNKEKFKKWVYFLKLGGKKRQCSEWIHILL